MARGTFSGVVVNQPRVVLLQRPAWPTTPSTSADQQVEVPVAVHRRSRHTRAAAACSFAEAEYMSEEEKQASSKK